MTAPEPDDAHQPSEEAVDTSAILTVPNLVTLVRLLCFPLFLWLLFGRDDRLAAALLLAGLGATDWVDGWYARRFHAVSDLGKVLDPVADRVLLVGGVTAILVDGAVPVWVAAVTIGREVLVAGAGLTLAALGARRIDVTWAGKTGAFFLMFAFPMFLGSEADTSLDDALRIGAWACTVPGLFYSFVSAAQYVPLGRRALAEGRSARASHHERTTP